LLFSKEVIIFKPMSRPFRKVQDKYVRFRRPIARLYRQALTRLFPKGAVTQGGDFITLGGDFITLE
jgi:hypothetical protein